MTKHKTISLVVALCLSIGLLTPINVFAVDDSVETSLAAPTAGTVTRESGSAIAAAFVTAVVVGLLVSCTSFAYLIRKI